MVYALGESSIQGTLGAVPATQHASNVTVAFVRLPHAGTQWTSGPIWPWIAQTRLGSSAQSSLLLSYACLWEKSWGLTRHAHGSKRFAQAGTRPNWNHRLFRSRCGSCSTFTWSHINSQTKRERQSQAKSLEVNLQMSLDVIYLRSKDCEVIVLRHLALSHSDDVVARLQTVLINSVVRVYHTRDRRHFCHNSRLL